MIEFSDDDDQKSWEWAETEVRKLGRRAGARDADEEWTLGQEALRDHMEQLYAGKEAIRTTAVDAINALIKDQPGGSSVALKLGELLEAMEHGAIDPKEVENQLDLWLLKATPRLDHWYGIYGQFLRRQDERRQASES